MKITLEIKTCEECPHHKSERYYSADSFEDLRKIYCNKLNKYVHRWVEWNEDAEIPDECPIKECV